MSVAPHAGIIDFGTFTPPTASVDGIQGEVPQPLAGQQNYVLTANGWVALSSLGTLVYQGTWDASTNTPTLTSSVGTQGYYYVVSVAGSTNLNGITTWTVGDWAIFNGGVWQKIEGGSTVDITGGQINNTVIGNNTPAAGTFTTLTANSTSQFGKSSANYIQADGAATTLNPIISIAGSDTNVSMVLKPQGTGALDIAAGSKGVNISNGGTVTAITRTNGGSGYTTPPVITISPPTTAGGVQATATAATISSTGTPTVAFGGTGYTAGDVLTISGGTPVSAAATMTVTAVSGGVITAVSYTNFAQYTVAPSNPVSVTGGTGSGATFNVSWGMTTAFTITNAGSGYVEQPTVSFSGGGGSGAAAYATVGSGTTVRTLGSTMSFVANNECLRITDVGGAGTAYWNFFNGGTTASMRATASSQAAIQSASAVPISFSTNASTSAAEQFRVSHTASAVNYVQVTGSVASQSAAALPTISVQGSDSNTYLGIGVKSTTGYIAFYSGNSSGNQVFRVNANNGANTANRLEVTAAPSGSAPILSTAGGTSTADANISMVFQPKGTGAINLAPGSSGVNISNGGTVTAITRTSGGSNYTSLPTVTVSAPTTAGGVQATLGITLWAESAAIASGGTGYTAGDVLTVSGGTFTSATQITVATVSGGVITSIGSLAGQRGAYTVVPSNNVSVTGGTGSGATFTINWGVNSTITITNAGSGYVEQPTVTFSGGGGSGAAAYATVGAAQIVRGLNDLSFYTPGGEAVRIADRSLTTVNYVQLSGAGTTNAPRISGQGSDTNISLFASSKGTSSVSFYTNNFNQEQFRVSHTGSAVNYVQVTGAATTGAPAITTQGSDTNIAFALSSKGTGNINFWTDNLGARQFQIVRTASTVNYPTVTGSATGAAPAFSVAGTDTNIGLNLTTKGTGSLSLQTGGGTQFQAADTASAVNFLIASGGVSGDDPSLRSGGSQNRNIRYRSGTGASHLFETGAYGNIQASVTHTASAVNYVQVTGAATGGAPILQSVGSDTNIGLIFISKGTGALRFDTGGGQQFRINNTASAVNRLQATGSATGAAPAFSVDGTDTNIDLALTPKGTGLVQFGTHTATALTISGYIEIKDSAGNVRKLAVVT